MGTKILKPVRQKQIFNSKTYLNFDIKIPVADGNPMASDFIYNVDILDDNIKVNSESYVTTLNQPGFKVFSKIDDEAGQSLFRAPGQVNELKFLSKNVLEPPLHIDSYKFTADLGPITKQYMTMISLHNPFNICYDNMVAIAYFMNPYGVINIFRAFVYMTSRIPIFIKNDHKYFITCTKYLFENQVTDLNSNFNAIPPGNNFANNENRNIFRNITKFKDNYTDINHPNVRVYAEAEHENKVFNIAYNDGRYYGTNSAQPNDFFIVEPDQDFISNFNNNSVIKCIIQIANLAAAYYEGQNYTVNNGMIFINYISDNNIKFTGKYVTAKFQDGNSTLAQARLALAQFRDNHIRAAQIAQETGIDLQGITIQTNFNNDLNNNTHCVMTYSYNAEAVNPQRNALMDYAAKHLYACTLGLETFFKFNWALYLSGIYGHTFDYIIRWYDFRQGEPILNMELAALKAAHPEWSFVQHFGSPLASYTYDFKMQPEKNILLGYNLSNMSRIIGLKAMSISDKISYNTVYKTHKKPIGLFPCVFQNVDFYMKVKVWRSYRELLKLMKTRKQRDLIFDYLSHYGRRCMTVLDPYGIFLHFHNETKGINPSD